MTIEADAVILGTDGADTLMGTGADETIRGLAGDDTIWGGNYGGDDSIFGGAGSDTIVFRSVTDGVEIHAGRGADQIHVGQTSLFDDVSIDGGKGFDTLVADEQSYFYQMSIEDIERFEFGVSSLEIRASEDQVFNARGRMKVEIAGSDEANARPHQLVIGSSDGSLDASRLTLENWGPDDIVGLWGDVGDDMIVGSDYADVVIGWAGSDTLDGGAGADLLRGGTGSDVFVVDGTSGPDAIDVIDDFVAGEDSVRLEGLGLDGDRLGKGAFRVGPAAADASDRIVYDPETGALYYDQDGSGAAFGALKIAQLDPGLVLSRHDFLLG